MMQQAWPHLAARNRTALWTLEGEACDEVGLAQRTADILLKMPGLTNGPFKG